MGERLQNYIPESQRFSDSVPTELTKVITDSRIRSYRDSDYQSLSIWMKDLSKFYDGHDENNKLLDQLIGAEKADKAGFFTKNKFMFVCEVDNEPAGMICLNCKRGGSTKIGPVIVNSEVRGQGVGSSLINVAEEIATASDTRKLYATTSHLNGHINHLFEKAGYKIEAEFPDQYKKGSIELIWGKHLTNLIEVNGKVQSVLNKNEVIGDLKIDIAHNEYLDFILKINEVYQQWHDDLGNDFVQGMIAGTERELSFQNKGKIIFIAKDEDGGKGMMTFTPKRGGPVKLYPLYGNSQAQKNMIENAKIFAKNNNNHKFYTFVHVSDVDQIEFLESIGFSRRGVIESPYKPGHDLVPLDINI
ncbi:MAG: GNAT family N-acetyltransferase [Candidatus Shapirobacteria bacterium]